MVRTDWTYEDIVKPEDMNQIGTELNQCIDQVNTVLSTPITLTAGTQVINVDRDTPISNMTMQGRTLVNFLGRDGNCEDLKPFGRVNATVELDSTHKQFGSNSLKVTISATTGYGQRTHVIPKNSGMYLFCGYVKNGNLSGGAMIEISDNTYARRSQKVTDTEKFNFVYGTIDSSLFSSSTASFNAMGSGASGEYAYFDGLAVYWIPDETKTDIDSGRITSAQIEKEYGYIDSLQNVNAVNITNKAEDGRKSHMYLPTCQLASNMDGADRMYMDNEGKPRVIRQFKRIELDGDNVQVDYNMRGTDYKRLNVRITNFKPLSFVTVKYDGKILKNVGNEWTGGDEARLWSSDDGHIFSVWNSDSGWGPDYTPTKEEIKAYLLGWKMAIAGQDRSSIYNGTGQKTWIKLTMVHNPTAPLVSGDYTGGVLPTSPAGTDSQGTTYTPYLLQYQLATPIDEPLEHEGSLMLYEGANQVEVGTGIVVREAFGPYLSNGIYYFNAGGLGTAKYRVKQIIDIYKNGNRDQWDIKTREPGNGYNNYGAQFATKAQIDPSAVYQVTYLALDTYKIGIAPTEISAEYASNLRGTVDSLVEGNKNALSRISVVESQMQMKVPSPPQWITPALLNGWVPYGAAFPIGYSKDDAGNVWIKGIVKGGTVSNNPETGVIFVLPKGYRPAEQKSFSVRSDTTSQSVLGAIILEPDGRVRAFAGSHVLLSLSEVSFRAEQ